MLCVVGVKIGPFGGAACNPVLCRWVGVMAYSMWDIMLRECVGVCAHFFNGHIVVPKGKLETFCSFQIPHIFYGELYKMKVMFNLKCYKVLAKLCLYIVTLDNKPHKYSHSVHFIHSCLKLHSKV